MPLEKGPVGSPAFRHNIETEMAAGKPQKQAVAIAYNVAGERRDALDDLLNQLRRLDQRMAARLDRQFVESDHPRDEDGKFTEGAGTHGSAAGQSGQRLVRTERNAEGRRTLEGGGALPEHIEKLKLPPAWTDVKVSLDPNAGLQAQGKDAKGRLQSVYSAEHAAKQAAEKFARVKMLADEFDAISRQNSEAQRAADAKLRDSADCLALIMATGIRPGSDDDTGADKKAYGATTLKEEHVIVDGDSVRLRFTGKKGVSLDLPVKDEQIARMLVDRAKRAGPDGRLFPNTNDKRLLDHTHSLDSGKFKTKDFRTHLGTRTAAQLIQARKPPPKTEMEYRRAVMDVAKQVAAVLGNTPTIALQSYISPAVFSEWGLR